MELPFPEFEGACGRKDAWAFITPESISFFLGEECIGAIPREFHEGYSELMDQMWELFQRELEVDFCI